MSSTWILIYPLRRFLPKSTYEPVIVWVGSSFISCQTAISVVVTVRLYVCVWCFCHDPSPRETICTGTGKHQPQVFPKSRHKNTHKSCQADPHNSEQTTTTTMPPSTHVTRCCSPCDKRFIRCPAHQINPRTRVKSIHA
jgi:hypothetical protein